MTKLLKEIKDYEINFCKDLIKKLIKNKEPKPEYVGWVHNKPYSKSEINKDYFFAYYFTVIHSKENNSLEITFYDSHKEKTDHLVKSIQSVVIVTPIIIYFLMLNYFKETSHYKDHPYDNISNLEVFKVSDIIVKKKVIRKRKPLKNVEPTS